MAYAWDSFNRGLDEQKKREKEKQEYREQQAREKELETQQQGVASGFGVGSLEGTGYSSFRELVDAYNRKMKSIASRDEGEAQEETRHRNSGISSLVGKKSTLG